MEHAIVELPAATVIGLGLECPGFDTSGIGKLWEDFSRRSGELPAGRMWGISLPGAGGFRYVAGVEVPQGTAVPAGLETARIAGGRYMRAPFNAPPPAMQAAFGRLYRELLPAAGETPVQGGPCLELYAPDCWDAATGSLKAELYVPLA